MSICETYYSTTRVSSFNCVDYGLKTPQAYESWAIILCYEKICKSTIIVVNLHISFTRARLIRLGLISWS